MAKLTKAQRASLHAMFDGRCAYCGSLLGDRWHADHLEPVLRGYAEPCAENPQGILHTGRDVVENLMPACAPCNLDKTSFTLEQWRKKLAGSIASLQRYSSTWRHALRFGLVAPSATAVVFYFERAARQYKEAKTLTRCAANRDGECGHGQCPQLRDNEPLATGRHCPLDVEDDE
jgi:hypothetical protein